MKRGITVGALAIVLFACRGDDPAPVMVSASNDVPVHVDSIFPNAEQIRRFKAARNGAAASELSGGALSRDALVDNLRSALQQQDTSGLRALLLTPAEFIDLYYPTSMYARPPYTQSPEITWLLIEQNSKKGMHRLLERLGGAWPGIESYSCSARARVEGANRLWEECIVRLQDNDTGQRVFGSILEHGGRYKFLSYTNDF